MKDQIQNALACLRLGEAIICPSESCYSISCNAASEEAVNKIRKIKNDAEFKPMTILASRLEQIDEFGILNETAIKIAEKLMPGQINLIIEKRNNLKYNFLSKAGHGIAFRIPANKIMIEIIDLLGTPITTTSANLHGFPSLYKIDKVKKIFQEKVCSIIDAGDLNESIPVSAVYDTRIGKVLREGLIGEKEIIKCLR